VHECEEKTRDEQLVIGLEQHMEAWFVDWLERFEEQIRALYEQFACMGGLKMFVTIMMRN
jgi:hypothetical protein